MAVTLFFLRRDGSGVVPEIESVHIAEVEPESHLMGMVGTFIGDGDRWGNLW